MSFAWLREASPEARRALLATTSGWMLDAMDVMLYAFALTAIRAEFGLDGAQAGLLASVTLIASAVGGIGAGILADRFGRRPVFLAFVLGAAVVVPAFGLFARSEAAILLLAPLVGYLGHGYFSVFGALLAELFPSAVRGAAQGFCCNARRAVSARAPFTIGALADRHGIGSALALTAAFDVAGAFLMRFLPETKGQELA